MAEFQWTIDVANPSPYSRSDYVESDLEAIGVDASLDVNSLQLFQKQGNNLIRIPFQVDYMLGKASHKRSLSFFCEDIPSQKDDYSQVSATYLLGKGVSNEPMTVMCNKSLHVDYYYDPIDPSSGDHQKDGFNDKWDPERTVYGVKLRNSELEIYVSLVHSPLLHTDLDYTGSVTSVLLRKAPHNTIGNPDNMLSPQEWCANKRWGQITKLVFYPPPWEIKWYFERSLLNTEYTLVYSNAGPIRAMVILRSQPFTLSFSGKPLFDQDKVEISCNLFRTISLYPDKPFYNEELFVLSAAGQPLSFRPYFLSKLQFPSSVFSNFARMEHIPDYFALWKNFHPKIYHGYGFASNSHVRNLELNDAYIQWRLQLNFFHKAVHYFMFNDIFDFDEKKDFFHVIGHFGWYEQIYKPLEVLPVRHFHHAKRYT
ncbi:MAG: hypothetical protein HY881_27670 [Deltaproteobacteria bacterium]|nr:hypothetical protein [Deltaproteobacteria bacterium]